MPINASNRRHLFISHHHKDDRTVSDFLALIAGRGYDVRNSSIRAKPANQKRLDEGRVSNEVIRRLLRIKISWASTVVVLIGKETHQRPWVDWEIKQAHQQGKRIVGVYARGGSEADIPKNLEKYGSALAAWNTNSIISAIDGDNSFQSPDGSIRQGPNSSESIRC